LAATAGPREDDEAPAGAPRVAIQVGKTKEGSELPANLFHPRRQFRRRVHCNSEDLTQAWSNLLRWSQSEEEKRTRNQGRWKIRGMKQGESMNADGMKPQGQHGSNWTICLISTHPFRCPVISRRREEDEINVGPKVEF
jgi:hypothetical protein